MDDATQGLRYHDRNRHDRAGAHVRVLVRPEPVQRDDGWVLRGVDEQSGAEAEVPLGNVVGWSRAGTGSTGSAAPAPGIYRHYKGRFYWLIDVARHSETEEDLAVYRCLYGDFSLWVRPLAMFTEQVEVDGVLQPRFAYVGPFAG